MRARTAADPVAAVSSARKMSDFIPSSCSGDFTSPSCFLPRAPSFGGRSGACPACLPRLCRGASLGASRGVGFFLVWVDLRLSTFDFQPCLLLPLLSSQWFCGTERSKPKPLPPRLAPARRSASAERTAAPSRVFRTMNPSWSCQPARRCCRESLSGISFATRGLAHPAHNRVTALRLCYARLARRPMDRPHLFPFPMQNLLTHALRHGTAQDCQPGILLFVRQYESIHCSEVPITLRRKIKETEFVFVPVHGG